MIVPLLTCSSSARTPNRRAAAARRMPRASAPAARIAPPLCSTDWLPKVYCSSGPCDVSAETMRILSNPTSSSSAAICASAVRIPCPSSALPVKTVTVPSASKRIQPSSFRLLRRLNGTFAGTWPNTDGDGNAKVASTTPNDCVTCLRESLMTLIAPAPWQPCERRLRSGCGCHSGKAGPRARP